MARDYLRAARDDHLLDVAANEHCSMTELGELCEEVGDGVTA
jgi:hypothetical protein